MAGNDVQFAPIRTFQDYLLGSARFGLPDYQNKEKWNYRIVNNLLYYQTNYMISALVIFLIVGYVRPYEMILGGILVGGTFAGTLYVASNSRAEIRDFKRKYPGVVIGMIITVSTMLMYALGSVLVFIFGIALPMFCILLHASLRMRNLKNKVNNKVESVGLKTTPMGILMKAMDQEF
ncbi:PRA1 family protein 3-like isoform X1 [Styela clava]